MKNLTNEQITEMAMVHFKLSVAHEEAQEKYKTAFDKLISENAAFREYNALKKIVEALDLIIAAEKLNPKIKYYIVEKPNPAYQDIK